MSIQKIQKDLAKKLVEYHKEVDPYEFKCCYDTDEMAYNDILKTLKSKKGINMVIKVLENEIIYYSELEKEDINDYCNYSKLMLIEVFKYVKKLNELEKGR